MLIGAKPVRNLSYCFGRSQNKAENDFHWKVIPIASLLFAPVYSHDSGTLKFLFYFTHFFLCSEKMTHPTDIWGENVLFFLFYVFLAIGGGRGL